MALGIENATIELQYLGNPNNYGRRDIDRTLQVPVVWDENSGFYKGQRIKGVDNSITCIMINVDFDPPNQDKNRIKRDDKIYQIGKVTIDSDGTYFGKTYTCELNLNRSLN